MPLSACDRTRRFIIASHAPIPFYPPLPLTHSYPYQPPVPPKRGEGKKAGGETPTLGTSASDGVLGEGALKSDSGDAQLIASYLREHHKTLRAWRLPEPKLRQLKLLVSDRDKVVQEKVRLQNQHRRIMVNDITAPEAHF